MRVLVRDRFIVETFLTECPLLPSYEMLCFITSGGCVGNQLTNYK